MKLSPLVLGASVLGNIALAALIVTHAPGRAGSSGSAATSRSASSAMSGDGTSSGSSSPAAGGGSAKVDPQMWGNLSSGDYAAEVARLRAEGFPLSVVRSILWAQVNESFAARRKALTGAKTDVPFWMPDSQNDPKVQAALRDLSREQNKLMKELLGNERPDEQDPMYAAAMRRQYGDLARDKIDQINRVQQDYNDLKQEIYFAAGMGAGGPVTITPDDRAKMALLEKEQREDIKRLLSPQEFEDYELRSSNTANQMRYQLAGFTPSEQEFRTIFPLQRAFDEQYNMTGAANNPEAGRQRMEAQKALTEQVKATLGPERGAEYERAIDGNFQQISRVVQRLELPKESAVAVWNLQKETEQRVSAVRQDRSLDPAARDAQMAALNQDVTTKLTSTLGQRGLDVYKQYGGYWLQNLQPRPAQGAAPASGTREMILSR